MAQMGLKGYKPEKEFLVCIDSDGCVFDTMEIKHKECFCPATVEKWDLQPISKYVREAWDYVNLYSTDRGINRFLALIKVIELLEQRPEVKEIGAVLPDMTALKQWAEGNSELNNQNLSQHQSEKANQIALAWSYDCNDRITVMVRGMKPFPKSEDTIRSLSEKADIVVVSATAEEALLREWEESNMAQYVKAICGQESGSKKSCIAALKAHYLPEKILMIGDAIGDYTAARDNGVYYYPIIPNEEKRSWGRLKEIVGEFYHSEYDNRQKEVVEEFTASLLTRPQWIK